MQLGWVQVGRQWFFLATNPVQLGGVAADPFDSPLDGLGSMVIGRHRLPFSNTNNTQHYFMFHEVGGQMLTGWQNINFPGPSNPVVTGRNAAALGVAPGWYRFAANGTQIFGWTRSGAGYWYYLDNHTTNPTGRMLYSGRVAVQESNDANDASNAWFLLRADGRMLGGGNNANRIVTTNVTTTGIDNLANTAGVYHRYITRANGSIVLGGSGAHPLLALPAGATTGITGHWERVGTAWYRIQLHTNNLAVNPTAGATLAANSISDRLVVNHTLVHVDNCLHGTLYPNNERFFSFTDAGVVREGWIPQTLLAERSSLGSIH
jgi:hypothetical protein